jgi:hypothetical protein
MPSDQGCCTGRDACTCGCRALEGFQFGRLVRLDNHGPDVRIAQRLGSTCPGHNIARAPNHRRARIHTTARKKHLPWPLPLQFVEYRLSNVNTSPATAESGILVAGHRVETNLAEGITKC